MKFWVEQTFQNSYMIVSQVKGYDATEAYSEHFKYKKDAENMAQQMAEQS